MLDHGGPGYLQFAITNICNADCGFCGFARSKFDPKARRSVTLQEARDVIDIAVKNHIGYLLFVGGEPMVHRDLRAMTRYAAERDALIPDDRAGPRPSGGVGGTRQGVKCLHAHLAWWLAGGDDVVGDWVAERLGLTRPEA